MGGKATSAHALILVKKPSRSTTRRLGDSARRLFAEYRLLASPGVRGECTAQIAAGSMRALVIVQAFVVGRVMTGPALDLPAAEVSRWTAKTCRSAVGVGPASGFDAAMRTTNPRPSAASLVGVNSTAAAQGAVRAVTVVEAFGDDATACALASELMHVETYGVVRALAVGRACAVQIAAFSTPRFERGIGAWRRGGSARGLDAIGQAVAEVALAHPLTAIIAASTYVVR